MKITTDMSFTWSGMTTQTVRADFNVTVTPKDIVEHSYGEISLEEIVAWTVDQLRAYVEENMLDELVEDNIGGGHVYNTYCEHDDDMEFAVNEEVEG
jgi:hypothetical protein